MWVEDDTMKKVSPSKIASGSTQTTVLKESTDTAETTESTAPHGDGRHGGDHLNLLYGNAGTTSQARIARSSTYEYVRCQGG